MKASHSTLCSVFSIPFSLILGDNILLSSSPPSKQNHKSRNRVFTNPKMILKLCLFGDLAKPQPKYITYSKCLRMVIVPKSRKNCMFYLRFLNIQYQGMWPQSV
jgi:hypothetical protein